jgi:hypothetical protein
MTAKPFSRRCPICGSERPAAEFHRAGGKANPWTSRRVVCPACGHVAPRSEFAAAELSMPDSSLDRRACRGVGKDGAACGQVARSGSGFCRWHDPAEPRGMA